MSEVSQLLQIIEQLKEQLAKRDRQIQQLEQRVDYLCRQLYGVKSEKLSPDQLSLQLGELTPVAAPPPATIMVERKVTPKGQGRIRLPQNLPCQEVVITPDEVKAHPDHWIKVGEDKTETLDYQPGHVFKRLYIRPRFKRRETTLFIQAPMPPRPIEKCMAEPGLLAQIVLDKYGRHLPLYRQGEHLLLTQDVFIPRCLLSDWTGHVTDLFQPVYGGLWQELSLLPYLQADETPVRYLDLTIKGKCGQGYFWLFGAPGNNVWIQWKTSRGREGPENLLKDYRGKLQTDGYAVYEGLCRDRDDLIHVGCWAHARRKFFESQNENPSWALPLLTLIGELYALEREIKDHPPEYRTARRQEALPVLMQIRERLESAPFPPATGLAKAVAYTLRRWRELTRYVEDGLLEIDNNLLENTIRPTAVGKKNWLFVGSPEAGHRSAILYSVILTCRRLGINPHTYIRDYLSHVATLSAHQAALWTPAKWLARQNNLAASPVTALV